MAWQDELRRLDEEWAAGGLSEDDYRRRRAELAAQIPAEGGGPPAQGSTHVPASAFEQTVRNSPFPPAFRWEGTPKAPPADTTDVVDPAGGDTESTQVVPAQPPLSYDDPESTQVVQARPPAPPRFGPFASPGAGFPAEHDQWEQQASMPPWASSELSPAQEPGSEPPAPDLGAPRRSEKPALIMAVIAVTVVLVVGGGLGAYLLWGLNGTSDAGQPPVEQGPVEPGPPEKPAAPAQPAAPAPPPPGSDLPDPADIGGDGEPRVLSTLEQLRSADVLPPQAYEVLADTGATSSKLFASTYPDGLRATVLITRLGSPNAAAAARDELAGLQGRDGLQELQGNPEPGLRTFYPPGNAPGTGPTIIRGLYHSGDLLVWMEAAGQEPLPTGRRYRNVVSQQLATLAPDR